MFGISTFYTKKFIFLFYLKMHQNVYRSSQPRSTARLRVRHRQEAEQIKNTRTVRKGMEGERGRTSCTHLLAHTSTYAIDSELNRSPLSFRNSRSCTPVHEFLQQKSQVSHTQYTLCYAWELSGQNVR